MELQRVLTKYLETHKRIVVPQLGAFLVKEPGKSILFSELVKRDDGVLRGLLMADERSEVEAAGAIDRFVFEVRHAVESGTEYRLADFGTMMPGPNGTIRFSYRPVVRLDRPIRPAEPVPAPSVVRQTPPVPNPVGRPAPEPASTQEPVPRAEEPSVQPEEPESSCKSHIDTARVAETVRKAFSDEPDEPDDADAPTKKSSTKRPGRSYEYEAGEEADKIVYTDYVKLRQGLFGAQTGSPQVRSVPVRGDSGCRDCGSGHCVRFLARSPRTAGRRDAATDGTDGTNRSPT